jgi:hypothetical protein
MIMNDKYARIWEAVGTYFSVPSCHSAGELEEYHRNLVGCNPADIETMHISHTSLEEAETKWNNESNLKT